MKNKPFLAVIAAAILSGSSGVFIKNIEMAATSLGFIRSLLPVLMMAGIMFYKGIPLFRGNYRLMMVASGLNALRLFLFITAYTYTNIGNAVIIIFTWPVFVTIFSAFFLGESTSLRNILLLILAFVGIVIIYTGQSLSFENDDFLGMTAALGTAICHAIGVVIFKKESVNYSRYELLFYQNLLGILLFLPFFITTPLPSGQDIGVASVYSLLLGTLGFSLFLYGLTYLKASVASAIAYIEIVSALFFAVMVMREPITLNIILGGGLVVVSTAFLRRR